MAKFNREKVLRQLEFKRKWRNYSRYVYIAVPCVLCCLLCLYFAYSKFFVSEDQVVIRTTVGDFINDDDVIGAYIDGEYSSTIPGKNDGYIVEKVSCDNGAVGKWNSDDWGLFTTNLTKKTKCNVYFKIDPIKKIIAQLDTTGNCPTVNVDGSVNVTEGESTNSYLCKAKDAYGDSYYYRGNVTNNYVKFGEWQVRKYFGYYSDTSNDYQMYDSLEECQNASSYNKKCAVGIDIGTPMYWRIIRINGDGTVRVIYDGISAHANGESNEDRQIGTSAFNSSYNDNAYVGYMYGNSDIVEPSEYSSPISFKKKDTLYISKEYTFDENTKLFTLKNPIQVLGSNLTTDYIGYYYADSTPTSVPSSVSTLYKIMGVTTDDFRYVDIKYGYVYYGTSSKEVAQTNTNDSTIKTYIDNWYKTNIVGTTNEQYLADNIFCNDRSISIYTDTSYNTNTKPGYGTNSTLYRWGFGPQRGTNYGNMKMMLTCPQKNDAFTVSDTSKGNGALTYPVGLLSEDEIVLAGGWDFRSNRYYLSIGQTWWTSSPQSAGPGASVWYLYSNGDATYLDDGVNWNAGVRPVFNLKAEVLAQGSGTASDPYRISS